MKASETTLQQIIEGSKQYIVPLFQRSYSWERKQWQILWDDLAELCEPDAPNTHFIGSIVTMQTVSVPEGVPKYLLIDGQQRLTTIFILLSLLRDLADGPDREELAEEIDKTLLVNPYKKGNEYFKLLPTQVDRTSFQALISKGSSTVPNDRIGSAYSYFDRRLKQSGLSGQVLKKVITERLSVVSIVLDKDDNPYLVFESLNAKGAPLSQADLIRNFFFLKIHVDQQDAMHAAYWQPMQVHLGDRLTEFVRHYLMKDGVVVRSDAVYFTLKERLGQGDALGLLKELSKSATHYRKLLFPADEPDPAIRESLLRLNRLEVSTAYPFLLSCYHELDDGRLSSQEFREILNCIENYIIRRFVCGVPTNQLNKIFSPLFNQIRNGVYGSLLDGVRMILSGRGYPKDSEFKARLCDAKLYGHGDRQAKTKLILERIDRSSGHKEAVDYTGLNVEHIMPQTLTDSWRSQLGDRWQETHEFLLHTLGNLTLTGYNSELSNSDFSKKKDLLDQSHVGLNDYFGPIDAWDEEAIEQRASSLAEAAVGVWPYFGNEGTSVGNSSTKEKPRRVRFLGREENVDSWRDVLEFTLNSLIELDPERFEEIVQKMPRFLGQDPSSFISSRKLKNGIHANMHFSAKDINRFCHRVLQASEIDQGEWIVEMEYAPPGTNA